MIDIVKSLRMEAKYQLSHNNDFILADLLNNAAIEIERLNKINIPMKPIMDNWESSKCPSCKKSYDDYEECDDGYYDRAMGLDRCPFCGQKLDWWKDE